MDLNDLAFTFVDKESEITLFHFGKKATVLRKAKAIEFRENAKVSSDAELQQMMARMTGNYKRGNEKQAKLKRKDRYRDI